MNESNAADGARYRQLTHGLFESGVLPPEVGVGQGATWWFVFKGNSLLVELRDGMARPPLVEMPEALGLPLLRRHFIGRLDGVACVAAEVAEDVAVPDGCSFRGLRSLHGLMDEDFFWIGGRAVQVVDWDRTHQYCGRCGAQTGMNGGEFGRICPGCGLVAYPRLAPAVIVAVTRQGKILLARSQRHPSGLFSVLAGFVEPGETLEQCVAREVKEETGLEVENIRYFGSQPWPFPHSLMVAFTCESRSGEIHLHDEELVEAAWFAPDALPQIPPPLTISRHMIDWFVRTHAPSTGSQPAGG